MAANQHSGPAEIKLRIGTLPVDQAAQPFYAREAGLFAKNGLAADVVIFKNGPAIAEAIAAGTLDIGYSNAVTPMRAYDSGMPYKVIFAANMYDAKLPVEGLLTVAKSSSIRTAADFAGKTVGVGGLNTIVPLSAMAWIDKAGGDSRSVKFVEVPFLKMAEAIKAGQIDGAQLPRSADPTLGRAESLLHVVAPTFSAIGDYFVAGFWCANTDFIREQSEAIRRFQAAMRETAVWARAHHDRTAKVLADEFNFALDDLAGMPRVGYGMELNADTVQPVIDAAAHYGLLKSAFRAADFLKLDSDK